MIVLGLDLCLVTSVLCLDGDHEADIALLDLGRVNEVTLSLCVKSIIIDGKGGLNLTRQHCRKRLLLWKD